MSNATRLSAEERAVIEAAERWADKHRDHWDRGSCSDSLYQVVSALRESRRPKPRYRVDKSGKDNAGQYEIHDHGPHAPANLAPQLMYRSWSESDLERICRLLNEADK